MDLERDKERMKQLSTVLADSSAYKELSKLRIDMKSIGMLIDELVTTDIKCYMAQETVMKSDDEHLVSEASKLAQALNKRRNELMTAIDERLGEKGSPTSKTY